MLRSLSNLWSENTNEPIVCLQKIMTATLLIVNYKIRQSRHYTGLSTEKVIKTYFCPILKNFPLDVKSPTKIFISEYNERGREEFLFNRRHYPSVHKLFFSNIVPKKFDGDLFDFIVCDNQTAPFVESRIRGLARFLKTIIPGGQLTCWKPSKTDWPALNIYFPIETDFPKLDFNIVGDGLVNEFPTPIKSYLDRFLIEDLTRLIIQYCQDNCPIQKLFFNN